jgi:hypothetical protein
VDNVYFGMPGRYPERGDVMGRETYMPDLSFLFQQQ